MLVYLLTSLDLLELFQIAHLEVAFYNKKISYIKLIRLIQSKLYQDIFSVLFISLYI